MKKIIKMSDVTYLRNGENVTYLRNGEEVGLFEVWDRIDNLVRGEKKKAANEQMNVFFDTNAGG